MKKLWAMLITIVFIVITVFYCLNSYKYSKILSNNESFVGTKLIIETNGKCSIDGQDLIITDNLVNWGYEDAISYTLDKKRLLVKIPNLINSDIIANVVSDMNKSSIDFKKFNNGKWLNSDINIKDIKTTNIAIDANKKFCVSIVFTENGKNKLAKITKESIGKPLGIFFNGELFTAPTINEPILNGEAQISGGKEGFTQEEAGYFQGLINCTKYQGKVIAKKIFY